jgi:hypothetical protein
MKSIVLLLVWLAFVGNVTAQLPSWTTLVDRARWAANAHNVQSWRLTAVPGRPDQRVLALDPARLLPQTDPPSRQLTISLGTFLAVLEDEAGSRGAQVTSEPRPDTAITLTLAPGPVVPLNQGRIDALTAPTVKYATRSLVLDEATRRTISDRSTPGVRVTWIVEPGAVAEAKRWAQGAYDLEMDLPRTRDESIIYTHYGEAARKATPWGITLRPNFTKDQVFWVEAFAALFPQSSTDYARSAKDLLRQGLGPVQQLIVVTCRGDGLAERVETGKVVQRVWLDVRSRGGELLPLSQGLEEFPEMAKYYDDARQRWAQDGETVQMVLAVFQPAPGGFLASPRLPAAAFLEP